jgi:hypothetical protein
LENRRLLVDIYSVLWPVHAILMGAAFLAMLIGMFISRYGKGKKWWFKTHRWLGRGGSMGALVALILSVVMISFTHGAHLSSLHAVLGAITIVLLLITPFLGARMMKREAKNKKAVRIVHRWMGRATLVMMAVTILFGLRISGLIYF